VVHLSTGDILRAAVKEGTELGLKAKAFMDGGQLVPDELIIDVICDRLKQDDCVCQGWLLDGFPRTEKQAKALTSAGMVPDAFVLLDVEEDVLVERVTGRRTDPETGKIYHMKFSPPENEEIAGRLVQRSDDTAEKIVIRYREFQSHIDSIKSSYADKTIWVDGAMSKDDVTNSLISAITTIAEKRSSEVMSVGNSPVSADESMKIIIAGAPAAGKGTQCEVIQDKFGVVHLSTGDILRAAVKEGTELGLKAKAFMDGGQLVPDELIIDVICDRLKQDDCVCQGWLLDGFPRTEKQAKALTSAGMVPDAFVLLDVEEDVLVERVTGRRTDPETGKIYHMKFSPPENEEIAGRLVQRSDDTAEKIVIRYREFQSHIDSIKSSYADKTIWVDGAMSKDDVTKCVIESLEGVRQSKSDDSSDNDDSSSSSSRGGSGGAGSGGAGTTGRGLGRAAQVISSHVSSAASSTAMGMAQAISNPLPMGFLVNAPQAALGMAILLTLDQLMKRQFLAAGIAFPSSLAGMVGLFGVMNGLQLAAPQTTDKLFYFLSHVMGFVKTWLVLFFAPAIIVLPLKVCLIKGFEASLAGLLFVGGFASLAATGCFTQKFSNFVSDRMKGTEVQGIPIPACAPMPSLLSGRLGFSLSLLSLLAMKLLPPAVAPVAQTTFETSAAITGYVAGTKLPAKLRTVLHPIITCALYTQLSMVVLGQVTGVPAMQLLGGFFNPNGLGAGDIIATMLGPAIISFGLQLFQYRGMLAEHAPTFAASTLFSAVFGLYSSAAMARVAGIKCLTTALSTFTRTITSPLAIASAAITGADASIAALLAVITGILGASFGENFLKAIKADDPLTIGIAVGGTSHGIGSAALRQNPEKFASAIVSMTLTAFWTVALLTQKPIRSQLVKLAIP